MLVLSLLACGLLGGDSPPSAPVPAEAPKPPAELAPPATSSASTSGTPLAALVATSGNALPLMDHDPKTGWRPHGAQANEGVLFRFEEPTSVTGVSLTRCPESADVNAAYSLYLDGKRLEGGFDFDSDGGKVAFESRRVRSLFLRVEEADDRACLGEVQIDGAEVRAPRTTLAVVTASKTLEPIAAYRPLYLFDGRLDFGWVEGADGLGIGESIRAELPKGPIEVHAIELWNGYQRSPDHFAKNARAKRIAVITDKGRVELDVPDRMGPSKLQLPEPHRTSTLAIEILEATPGSRYEDLVLSEARVWDAEGPLSFVNFDKAAAFGRLTEARGTAVERLVDTLLVSACDPGARQLKLRSNASFVWWATDPMEDATEVFDGTWVFRGPKDGGTQVQLYGRRHVTTVDWSPYGTTEAEETVRIAGGKPVFTRVKDIDEATYQRKLATIEDAQGGLCDLPYERMKASDALLVEGKAFMDVLVKDGPRG